MINLYNQDCLPAMKEMPDKAYDLAIVDPPYGVKSKSGDLSGVLTKETKGKYKLFNDTRPNHDYFEGLFRVSKNQIVWGGNYFHLPTSRGWIYWHKQTPTVVFADGELAWTSFDRNLRCFDYMWTNVKEGMGRGFKFNKSANIHPTQKPVRLYEWLLQNYAKPGNRILDTHCGSGSILIACDILGFSIDAYEIDADYYQAAKERLERHQRQQVLDLK